MSSRSDRITDSTVGLGFTALGYVGYRYHIPAFLIFGIAGGILAGGSFILNGIADLKTKLFG